MAVDVVIQASPGTDRQVHRDDQIAGKTGLPIGVIGGGEPIGRDQMLTAPVRWAVPSRLAMPVEGRSARATEAFRTLGLLTVQDLLEHLPRDQREYRTVSTLRPGEQATVAVEVVALARRSVRGKRMRPLVQARVKDGSGSMVATFFNQPWLVDRYPPGTRIVIHGSARPGRGFHVSSHALATGLAAAGDDAVGHYAATDGITSTEIMTVVHGARRGLRDIVETLPGRLRAELGLTDRATALATMHFCRDPRLREAARRRLAFEELMIKQLHLLAAKRRRAGSRRAPALDGQASVSARWRDGLPFSITDDQRRAIEQIDEDLSRREPMQRLLMGEVGSGKTVVALHGALRAIEHGHQAALMAPTEALAEQHFATVARLMAHEPVPCALLTGSTSARRRGETLRKLASGELSLVVGTHALIEPQVKIRSLAVVVIDEQHRFGVRQRAALGEKAADAQIFADDHRSRPVRRAPHVLHMTATPIPRTLALTKYGDLDVTRLRQLPPGRSAVKTAIVATRADRARAYEHLRRELAAGRQAYVVCPLVDRPHDLGAMDTGPDARSEARAATDEYERLRAGELRGRSVALLHGQMSSRDKQDAMARFIAGEAEVLVTTTVIEVGIDVANATVMIVENAERFGISQLHQLRGRIGRGTHRSLCLLMGSPTSRRLRALVEQSDGFELAEVDLRLRSEGELMGTRQSGTDTGLRFARMPHDGALLTSARVRASAILRVDGELREPEHALLRDAVTRAVGEHDDEPIGL